MSAQEYVDTIIKIKEHLRDLSLQYFFDFVLFSWVWWLTIGLIIVPILIWWIYVDKSRLLEISVYGSLIAFTAVFLDSIGSALVLWEYPVNAIPIVPLLFPVDFVVLPVLKMTIYQKYNKWSSFTVASLVIASFGAFIAEPVAVWIGQYKLIHWQYIYSFPIYFIISMLTKLIVQRFRKIQDSYKD